jgi:hypothetical protein
MRYPIDIIPGTCPACKLDQVASDGEGLLICTNDGCPNPTAANHLCGQGSMVPELAHSIYARDWRAIRLLPEVDEPETPC